MKNKLKFCILCCKCVVSGESVDNRIAERSKVMNTYQSKTREDTIRIGSLVGKKLEKGDIICLEGSLGSGKTTLVKGIGCALDIKEEITSPTFTIVSTYSGSSELFHVDLYRIERLDELDDIGIDDILYGDGITVIEWGEKMASLLPENIITINIIIMEDNSRKISVTGLEKEIDDKNR